MRSIALDSLFSNRGLRVIANALIRPTTDRLRMLWSRCFVDKGDYRRSVLLAGSGRSGTTWVAEVLNHRNNYRLMFEPFHSHKVLPLKTWRHRQYLNPAEEGSDFRSPAETILGGGIKHEWIDQFNRRFLADQRLIKDIRILLCLKWIKRQFPEIPIVMLLRHPFAVVASQMRLGWKCPLDDLLQQDALRSDYLLPLQDRIATVSDLTERNLLVWCIENFVPLQQFEPDDMEVVFYEQLCAQPESEWPRVFHRIGQDYSTRVLERMRRPSALSAAGADARRERSSANRLDSWHADWPSHKRDRALEILSWFGLDSLYGNGPMPLVHGTEAIHTLRQRFLG